VGRAAAFREWLKTCEAVKKKYRNESGLTERKARHRRPRVIRSVAAEAFPELFLWVQLPLQEQRGVRNLLA
jgi:hypothetical protein